MSNILDKIKLSGTTYDIVDSTAIHSMDGYWTSGQTTSAITAATAALAETVAEELSGKVDTTAYTAYTAATDATLSGKADVGDIPSVTPYADSVKYNSTSKYVEFYHGGTGGTKVFEYDASPFLIDGMVQNVEIKDVTLSGQSVTCLVISFNTDAGKQDINIPLTEIFDASNYYTTAQTDNKITEATSGKADTSAVTAVNDVLTAHTANTDIHVTTTDKSTWSGKQDALVSGTNIKTINNQSILGSGNIDVQTLPTVSGTTLVFS